MSVSDGTSVIPPGWYPDPADAARLRRWDGQQWTQEVLLAPEQAPAAASVPTAPPAPQQTYAEPQPAPAAPAAPIIIQATPEPSVTAPPAPAPTAPTPPAAYQPPPGRPVPASPAPTVAPPGAPTGPPPAPQVPMPPTVPRPSPPVNQHANTSSGPVSLPEWSNLPGLTLPPDLSSLPGMESDSILRTPTFAEPEPQLGLPTLPVFEPPFIPQRPDVQDVGRARETPVAPRPATQQPSAPYAPPPSGAQYDVPPPPGMAHVPTAGPVLPPSAFVAPPIAPAAWPLLPPVGSVPVGSVPVGSVPLSSAPAAPTDFGSLPRTVPNRSFEPEVGSGTVSSWLIALLPLLQFAIVYVVFGILAVVLAPGMQWGILAAPAAFSLLFANADRKTLTDHGLSAPSIVFAFIPPLYLLVRCFTTGRSSVLPLVAWIVLQGAAAAGVYYLLPSVLSAAIRAIG